MISFSKISLLIFLTGILTTSCSKNEPAEKVKDNGLPKAAVTDIASPAYAIVDIDSLSKNYELCKERVKDLESKQNSYSAQLNNKMNAFQNHAGKFQENYQNGKFSSQQEFENAQMKLQKEQEAIQQLQAKIEADMAEAMQNYQSVLQDSIQNFIKDYNKKGKYKAIFSKIGNNVLFVDPSIDITDEVITGLNKRYKKNKK